MEFFRNIWDSGIVTNNGPYHQWFEEELARHLGVKYISLFSNGTLALLTALKALGIKGEVITTPYSFIATTHALSWNNIQPVFADVDPVTCNLDPGRIEAAITPLTTAILPVHVYGNPCNVEMIEAIAAQHGLKVIYDACQTFGVTKNGTPLLDFGHLSVISFHATKVFTTIEGGAIISHDAEMKKRLDHLKNFGFEGETSVPEVGINAKMNELQAAIGLLQLKHIEGYIAERKRLTKLYRDRLKGIKGLTYLEDMPGVRHCYTYFPVFIEEAEFGMSRDTLYEKLKAQQIHGRRYFYPLISQSPAYMHLESAAPGRLPVAEKIAGQVLCLPLFPGLTDEQLEMIVEQVRLQ